MRANERAFLAFIIPVRIDGRKIRLAEARHERDLPEDGLLPRASGVDMYAAPGRDVAARIFVLILGVRLESKVELLRLEAVGREVIEVSRSKVRTGILEPRPLVRSERNLIESYDKS